MTTETEREAFDVLVDVACEAINKLHPVGKKRFRSDMRTVVRAILAWQARAARDQRQGWAVTDEMVEAVCRVLQPNWMYFFEKEKGPYRDDVRKALQTALLIFPQSIAQPLKVPDDLPIDLTVSDILIGYRKGWNDCRAAMLADAPEYTDKKED